MSDKKKLKLFISYSHENYSYFEVFEKGFSKVILNAQKYDWKIWNDSMVHLGSFWDDEIQNNVKDCDVAILLVSVEFMSSRYIKEKEYNEFIKRNKEKGIIIIPIIFAPCDFEAWDDLSKLHFFKPKGADFGLPEIRDFTYADLIKFNEKNGQLIPNPNIQRYHLRLIKEIENSYSNYESEIINFYAKQESQSIIQNNKLNNYPKPTLLFTGRDSEKKQFAENLKNFKIFAVDGLGGTGKTQFVAKCIEEFIENKDKVIWLNGSAQSSFDVFVENSGYGNILKGDEKTDLILFSSLKDHIERDEKIIFWDNFNDYEDKSFANFLSFANDYLDKSRIILITKTIPEIHRVSIIPIISLEGLNKDAVEYAKKIKDSDIQYKSISDIDIEKICTAFQGHPLAIEFSLSLLSRGKNVDDLILHLPELSTIKKVEDFSKRLFLDIFNHPNTSEEERECFLKCSVFGGNITENEIKYLNDNKEVFHLINGLIDKLLLKVRDGYYEIHPLINSFSYEKLDNKIETHKKAALYFINERNNIFSPSLEEKIYYHLSIAEEWNLIAKFIEEDGKTFIQQGQLNFLSDILTKLKNANIWLDVFDIYKGDLAQIKSQWENALEHFNSASESKNEKIKAVGMIKNGEINFRMGYLNESLIHFENAFIFSNSNNLLKEKAHALNDIGLVYIEFSEPKIATVKLEEALILREKIEDQEGIASTLNNIGNIYQNLRKYDKALEFYQKSITIAEKIGDKINLALYHSNVANVLRNQGKTKESLKSISFALKLHEEIGNQSLISSNYNSTAACYINEKEYAKAKDLLDKALKIANEINDKKNIGTSNHNFGGLYFETENYELALKHLYTGLTYYREIGSLKDESNTKSLIKNVLKKLGQENFLKISEKIIYDQKYSINITEFINKPYSRETKKIGRNDIVKVKYLETKLIIETKYKKVEEDIENGLCILID